MIHFFDAHTWMSPLLELTQVYCTLVNKTDSLVLGLKGKFLFSHFSPKITVHAKIYEHDHSLKFLQKSQIFYHKFSWKNFYITCDFDRFSRKYCPDCCEKKFHKNIFVLFVQTKYFAKIQYNINTNFYS